jgi:hypothetical protein
MHPIPTVTSYAGIDWASRSHVACIVDQGGAVIERAEVEHTAAGLRGLVRRLTARRVSGVAIERPDGPVIDALFAAGLTVVVIASRHVKALRTRYGLSGNKDDHTDAYLLADVLRTDGHRLRSGGNGIPTRDASSLAPGSMSSGAAGRTACPTTRPSTGRYSDRRWLRRRDGVDIELLSRRPAPSAGRTGAHPRPTRRAPPTVRGGSVRASRRYSPGGSSIASAPGVVVATGWFSGSPTNLR